MENINFSTIYLIILLMIIFSILYFYFYQKERREDQQTDYSQKNILGQFGNINGHKAFFVKYKTHQPNKKQAILKKYHQGVIVETTEDNGLYKYKILDLHNDHFYFQNTNKSKDGPYVAYIVTPYIETNSSGISIDRTNGAIQIVTGNGFGYQDIRNNLFINKFKEYTNIMIQKGIPENAINAVLHNPTDQNIQKSFLETYGKPLAEIMINISGVVISLLDYLRGS